MIVTTLLISLIIFAKSDADNVLINEHLSEIKQNEIEPTFFNLLELPNVSKTAKLKVNNNSSTIRYMLDLYNFLISRDDDKVYNRNKRSITLNRKIRTALTGSNNVTTASVTIKSINKSKELSFNVGKLASNPKVDAELRIFQNGKTSKKNDELFGIKVYQILDSKKQKLQHTSSVNTTGNFTGWLSINMNLNLQEFEVKSLHLSVYSLENQEQILTEDIGLIFENNANDKAPFIVIFFPRTSYPVQPFMKPFSLNKGCKLRKLRINVANLQDDNILGPFWYEAGLCSGKCDNCSLSGNNYLRFLTFFDLYKRVDSDLGCCVPTEYHSLPVLYVDDANNIIMKHMEKMIVKSCGCLK